MPALLTTFGASEANLALFRDVLGPGFSEYTLLQGIRSNAIRLAAPGQEERQQWLEEDADKERLRLMNTPAHQLKREAAQGILDRRAQAQVEEADRVFAERETHDQQTGFPPLPQVFRGERLDWNFFVKKCNRQTLKFLGEKYGPANIEARIRGIR